MTSTAVLTEHGVETVDADLTGGRAVVDPADIERALGWSLRPEGLCRGAVCVPVRDRSAIEVGDRVDLAAVASHLGSTVTVASDDAVVAITVAKSRRDEALVDREAPDFELPDLDGRPHSLSSWAGHRRLLVAFATW